MVELKLKLVNKEGNVLCEANGIEFVDLVYGYLYEMGDKIVLSSSVYPVFLNIQLDDAIGKGIIYMASDLEYTIPFDEKKANMSPKAFAGDVHYMFTETVPEEELQVHRNLACNPYDIAGQATCYPHASANIETRNETVFAARNAIDGVRANLAHGVWPYTSWGINCRDDAEFMLEFGRVIEVNRLVLYTRADFPHDNWWTQTTVTFSDGESICWKLQKSSLGQEIVFEPRKIEWIKLHDLIKADDPSPFPALTQIEVYGKEVF